MSISADAEAGAEIERIIARHAGERATLLPLLHDIQHAFGFISDDVVPRIADALNISRADVHGVLTFYPDFRRAPAGRHVVKLCRAEACQARGAQAVERAAVARLGVAMGSTRDDRQVTLEPVYCLGLCAIGPAALIDGKPVAQLDPACLDRIATELSA